MIANHRERVGAAMIERLSLQEEAELDRYMASGVDIDEACIGGFSRLVPPLFPAISSRCPALVNALLDRGASISMMTIKMDEHSPPSIKESALSWILLSHDSEKPHDNAILNALLATPAVLSPEEINAPNHVWMNTNLAICVQTRNALVRDVLMVNGADTGCLDSNGGTLLHMLARSESHAVDSFKEDEEWLHWILSQGVTIGALDFDGNTALDLARDCRKDDDPFVALLASTHLERLTQKATAPVSPGPRRI